jgi:hypothetical protein
MVDAIDHAIDLGRAGDRNDTDDGSVFLPVQLRSLRTRLVKIWSL